MLGDLPPCGLVHCRHRDSTARNICVVRRRQMVVPQALRHGGGTVPQRGMVESPRGGDVEICSARRS